MPAMEQSIESERRRGRPKGVLNKPNPVIEARNAQIEEMFLAGMTLQAIGNIYSISRERVRQIMFKRGFLGFDGGAFLGWEQKALARQEARQARYQRKYGCSYEEFKELKALGKQMLKDGIGLYHTPLYAWRQQKHTYLCQGVAYELSLWDFWTLWRDSGHFNERGQGRYGLCRKDTSKGFTKDNVFIRKMDRETGWGEKVGGIRSKFKPVR